MAPLQVTTFILCVSVREDRKEALNFSYGSWQPRADSHSQNLLQYDHRLEHGTMIALPNVKWAPTSKHLLKALVDKA